MFGIISSNGDVMPPHFFPKGLRLNSEGYVALMKDVVAPWIKKVAAGRPYVFQQDSAPCHTSHKTQKWLENLDDYTSPNIWPLTPPTATRATTTYGARLNEIPTGPHATPWPS
ncbi:Uncharacterized protein FKW44_007847 [Caligus rogercresseyi]|uniref:Transposable element Tcb2 transposase n=1 Tax=Caligus rogercresseyi TaxID=217165 RepID=A0A7T8KFA2_CALRO|nr:Uncharacterized protein FKW44_007847 [Caligus rogercresseyi]